MSKREKLRQKLRNSVAEVNMQDVQTLLQRFGFTLARIRGSHHIFEYDDGKQAQQIVIPVHRHKVKQVYIREIIEILDKLFPLELNEENENGEDA